MGDRDPRQGSLASTPKYWSAKISLNADKKFECDFRVFTRHLQDCLFKMADNEETVKKRKRSTDGASKARKRVAIEGDKQVQISLQAADKLAPVIGMHCLSTRSFGSTSIAI